LQQLYRAPLQDCILGNASSSIPVEQHGVKGSQK